jgi:hypothetical protein
VAPKPGHPALLTARRGLARGWSLFVSLLKVMVPAYAAVAVLKHSPAMDALSAAVTPLMRALGLPPEAAVALVIGWCVSLYGGIGAMQALNLSLEQITQLAVVLLISHNLIVETGIIARLRARPFLNLTLRLGVGLGLGALMHYAFGFNDGATASGGIRASATLDLSWAADGIGLLKTLWKTFYVVMPLMVALEFLRTTDWLDRLSRLTARPLAVIGLEKDSVLPFWAGVLMGIVYGAGLLIEAADRNGFGGRQAFLVSVFLGMCHAIVEDTLLFANLGAGLFWLLVPRTVAAVAVTWLAAAFTRGREERRTAEASPLRK